MRPGQSLLQFGSWVMNVNERSLTNADSGAEVDLTSMEFDLLRVFAE
jgi:DNA-binding response OmpR family regulator